VETTVKMIDGERVISILKDCLYREEEVAAMRAGGLATPEGAIVVEAVMMTVGLHPGRLESHREEVRGMLDLLPLQFRTEKDLIGAGGGWSFLNACNDRNGSMWTCEHRKMEALFALGQGLGYVKPLVPKAMWAMFPGGMPYYAVTLNGN
jgi:hypothetical protein